MAVRVSRHLRSAEPTLRFASLWGVKQEEVTNVRLIHGAGNLRVMWSDEETLGPPAATPAQRQALINVHLDHLKTIITTHFSHRLLECTLGISAAITFTTNKHSHSLLCTACINPWTTWLPGGGGVVKLSGFSHTDVVYCITICIQVIFMSNGRFQTLKWFVEEFSEESKTVQAPGINTTWHKLGFSSNNHHRTALAFRKLNKFVYIHSTTVSTWGYWFHLRRG